MMDINDICCSVFLQKHKKKSHTGGRRSDGEGLAAESLNL